MTSYACRTTGNPEILLVNQVLLGEALKKAPSVWPHLRDYNELVYGSSAGPPDRGRWLDQPYDEDNTGFLGSGLLVATAKLPPAKVCAPNSTRSHLRSPQFYITLHHFIVNHGTMLRRLRQNAMCVTSGPRDGPWTIAAPQHISNTSKWTSRV